MNIVLVSETFPPAGDVPAETARQLATEYQAAGHRVLVLTSSAGRSTHSGALVVRTTPSLSPAEVRARIDGFGADQVHLLSPGTLGVAVLRGLTGTGVPAVILDPTGPVPIRRGLDVVLAGSASAAADLAALGIRAGTWRPGVRLEDHHPGLRSAEVHDRWARAGRPDGDLCVIGHLGPVRAVTAKPTRRLLRIAALPSVRLVVIGGGPGAAVLKRAGAKVLGETTGLEAARALASVDLLVQPRKHPDGLCAVRKALASAVPVVTFATPAARELVRDGVNGLLSDPADGRRGLVAATAELAADPALRARLAQHGRVSVRELSWASAAADLLTVAAPLEPAG